MSLIVVIRNITGERRDGTSDYIATVQVNANPPLWAGKIKGHKRSDGAGRLMQLVAEEMLKEENQ